MNIDPSIWNKVAQLSPVLRPQLQFTRQVYRDQEWYVLADAISGGHFRCQASVYQFLQMLDGQTSIQKAFEQVVQQHSALTAPRQEDILNVIATLQNKDLLTGDMPQSTSERFQRFDLMAKKTKFQRWSRPLSIKVSLWDPDVFLEKYKAMFNHLFTKAFFIIVMLVILTASMLALSHWQALVEHFSIRFMDAQNLLLIWLIYPLIKLIHELGHAIATKFWGGEVHDMGLLFIVFIPIPYVDASSSYEFSNKYHRMVVAGAGILVELLLAAIALLIWINLQDGWLRDFAFNIAIIGGLSSLLVNGNPLLRFDGYYVLSDAIEIPNLSTRSTQYLGHLCQRWLLGLNNLASPVKAKGERAWFVFYGIAAGTYRLFICFGIALFVATNYLLLGIILASWYAVQQVLIPMLSALKALYFVAHRYQRLKHLSVTASILAALFFIVLFVVPIQSSMKMEGVIALPEDAIIRAQVDGFLVKTEKQNAQSISPGDALFYFENIALQTKSQLIEAKLLELHARESEAFSADQIESQIIKEEILQTEAALNNVNDQLEKLILKSINSGVLSIESPEDMLGRYYHKGDVLAYVVNYSDIKVKAVISQDKLQELGVPVSPDYTKSVETQKREISVKLKSEPVKTLSAFMGISTPQASYQLPSAELGTAGGGNIMVNSRDESGLSTIDAIYQVELVIPDYNEHYLAAKVDIKIHHQSMVLAEMIYGRLRKMLVDEFQI